ncbi:MAG: acetyl-CoA C-acyltransferase [Crocinitomicaceae bacterium]|nr:acetyl-CoA C-acyltransferase [Crocinitomicaceae bacterium]
MKQNAYIVAGFRSAVGKAGKGGFRFYRPDDLAADVITHLMAQFPQLDPKRIDDVIVGNATPEAEQGLNVGRLISLMSLNTDKVPGMTVNRYCSSGLETMAIAKAKIEAGMADCIIAGGVESMSVMAMGGWRIVPNSKVAKEHPTWYWGMGLTAEAVAKQFNVTREEQDAFALHSNEKAIAAIKAGKFIDEIVPVTVENIFLDANEKRQVKSYVVDTDEGPRASTMEGLAGLRPVFAEGGSVTAGNSSQTSDGAAFVLMMSERMVKELGLEPVARLASYAVVGVEPRIMGIGPVDAIPKAIKMAGLTTNDINLFELNEAFASQSIAVIRETGINPEIVNVNGGAIAMGHPLGCTGAKLSVQIINELKKRDQKYGVVTMCVGTGQGAAGVIERL